MKYTSAVSLALAPVALAKVARNQHPEVKRDPSFGVGGFGVGLGAAIGVVNVAPIVAIAPPVNIASPLLLLYTNVGGGVPNQVINSQVTVTQTVQVPADGVPTQLAGFDGATQTLDPGASGTFPVTGQTHTVTVGGPLGQAYFPADITANVGDVILFNFMAQNHTVTQSSFDQPCVPLAGGMDSGFMSNPDNSIDPPPQVDMQVMTTEPLWMYCAQGNHCTNGMVLSVNPSLERTHAQFQQLAIGLGQQPAPAIAGGAPAGAAPADVNNPANLDPNLANPNLNVPDPNAIINDPNVNQPPTASIATGALNGGIVMGVGSLNADGSCNCAVQCDLGAASANIPAGVGVGGFGGQVAVIPMNAAGGGLAAQPVGAQSFGVQSVDSFATAASVGISAATLDPLAAATLDPLAAASVDPLAGASIDPLAGASIDPLAQPSGLIIPDPNVVGR